MNPFLLKSFFGIFALVIFGLYPLSFASAEMLTWSVRENMPVSRYGHTAASASNGKIYVMGGTYPTGGAVSQVDEYDPLLNTWITKSNMLTPRWGVAAISASNSYLYTVGGYTSESLATVEAYDAASDVWSMKTPMLTARQTLGLVQSDNGKIYAIGGGIVNGNLALATDVVEEYDPVTDTWTSRTSMPTARGGLGVAKADNGKIYAIGGFTSEPDFVTLATVEEYDPATDTWTTKNSMPTPRFHLSVVADNGKIYAIGGTNRTGDIFDVVEEYDPLTDTWTSADPMLAPRYNLAGVVGSNNRIYAIGGLPASGADTVEEALVTKQLSSLDPAKIWVGLKNIDDVGIKFDLKAEVYKDGVLVTSGQVNSVDGGNTGFNNAVLSTIPFDSFSPLDFPVGSSLSIKLSARNACTGSAVNSGKARLWFDSSSADSQFGAVFDTTPSDYFLSSAFALLTSPGPGPKQHIDATAGAQCSNFKTFGTWAITL